MIVGIKRAFIVILSCLFFMSLCTLEDPEPIEPKMSMQDLHKQRILEIEFEWERLKDISLD